MTSPALPDYWTCPECGRKFAKEGQRHVHDTTTVQDHLEGKPREVVALYERFVEFVEACGPVALAPTKRQIGFQVNRIFAGIRLTERGLEGYLDIARKIDSPRFRNAAPYTKRLHVHHFRISDLDQLDAEFAGWIAESYAVGCGEHLA